MKNLILKLRIILWLILTGVVGWLLYMGMAPGGRIIYVKNFTDDSYFIGKLAPEERVGPVENGTRKIIGDPVYFNLRTSRRFNKAELTIKYRKQEIGLPDGNLSSKIPIIEAGVLADKTIWRYCLKPVENRIIDQLAMVWDMARADNVMLLQRNGLASSSRYKSINEFLNNLPPRNEIALYNYNLPEEYILEDYTASEEKNPQILPALRGPYQFYTYIKNENLDFRFSFVDLNQNKDSDSVDLRLYYNDNLIDARHLDDDGAADDSGIVSSARELDFWLADLPEGVYKIELRANDDIVTRRIDTKQRKLAFLGKFWLAPLDSSFHPAGLADDKQKVLLFTDSGVIHAQTVNPGSTQIIKAGDAELNIEEAYKQFSVRASGASTKLLLEKSDVILAGDGVFSFNQDSIVNPRFQKVGPSLDINGAGINYIIAEYQSAKRDGGWSIATVEFDLSRAYREDRAYSFIISIPGLKADDNIKDGIEVGEIRVELTGKNLIDKIKELISE